MRRQWLTWWFFTLATAAVVASAEGAGGVKAGCSPSEPRADRSLFLSSSAPAPAGSAVFASVHFGTRPECARGPIAWQSAAGVAAGPADQAPATHPIAFEYSDAYQTRNHIHKLASFAMLPLFISEAVLGQQLFNNPVESGTWKRTAHKSIGMGIGGLFGVNSVTGVWNLIEARHDPNGGTRRTIHSVLMLVADGGFVATAFTRPNSSTAEGLAIYDAKKNQHMALVYASLTVAMVGYVIMLFN